MSEISAPVGAIVRVWFPESEAVMEPGPKFRPALVLDVSNGPNGRREALVAYGTSQNTRSCQLGEFTVKSGDAHALDRDTKFCLKRAVWLPLSREYFVGPAKFTQPPRPSDLRRSSLPSVPLSALRPTWRAAQIAAQKGP